MVRLVNPILACPLLLCGPGGMVYMKNVYWTLFVLALGLSVGLSSLVHAQENTAEMTTGPLPVSASLDVQYIDGARPFESAARTFSSNLTRFFLGVKYNSRDGLIKKVQIFWQGQLFIYYYTNRIFFRPF